MGVCILTDRVMFSCNGKNQPVYSELPLPFASPIISTRTLFPWAPLPIGLPVVFLPAEARGYLWSTLVNPSCVL
jgi:hypothetical protein